MSLNFEVVGGVWTLSLDIVNFWVSNLAVSLSLNCPCAYCFEELLVCWLRTNSATWNSEIHKLKDLEAHELINSKAHKLKNSKAHKPKNSKAHKLMNLKTLIGPKSTNAPTLFATA